MAHQDTKGRPPPYRPVPTPETQHLYNKMRQEEDRSTTEPPGWIQSGTADSILTPSLSQATARSRSPSYASPTFSISQFMDDPDVDEQPPVKKARAGRRGPLPESTKLRAALRRRLGVCDDCRARKVGCNHLDFSLFEAAYKESQQASSRPNTSLYQPRFGGLAVDLFGVGGVNDKAVSDSPSRADTDADIDVTDLFYEAHTTDRVIGLGSPIYDRYASGPIPMHDDAWSAAPKNWTPLAPVFAVDEESATEEVTRKKRQGNNWLYPGYSSSESEKSATDRQTDKKGVDLNAGSISLLASSIPRPNISPIHTPRQLAGLLFCTPGLRDLYPVLLKNLGSARAFCDEHAGVLKRYLRDLERSSDDFRHLEIIQPLASPRSVKEINDRIAWLAQRSVDLEGTFPPPDGRNDGGGDHAVSAARQQIYDTIFTTGKSFLTLKAGVRYLVDAPCTVSKAASYEDAGLLEIFLENHLDKAASGEYAWIYDLLEVGYTYEEIAELLYERAHDSPWIFFEPTYVPPDSILPNELLRTHHLDGCAHHLPIPHRKENVSSWQVMQTDRDREVRRTIEELCGIGGIASSTRDRSLWDGTVRFTNGNSVANISYRNASDARDSLRRMSRIAHRLCTALRAVQQAGYCCDSFTILSHDSPSSPSAIVTLRPISFSLVTTMYQSITTAAACSDSLWRSTLLRQCYGTVKILATEMGLIRDQDPGTAAEEQQDELLGILALMLQLFCVGFLSYAQAHLGKLQPFFLDTALTRIELLGMADDPERQPGLRLTASLTDVTCLEGMTKGPVLVFGREEPIQRAHDVAAAPEDLLDTWGPGNLVFSPHRSDIPVAIKIGGGYISPPLKSESCDRYHWDRVLRLPADPPALEMKRRIIIGGLVETNAKCRNNEDQCWRTSSSSFEELGTYRSYSEAAEYQIGFQVGSDSFAITGNKVWAKLRGKTIKDRNLQGDDYMLVPFLDFYWGVRVSYCTGVAQRVQLRDLISDLLPAFAGTLTNKSAVEGWNQLSGQHRIIEVLRTSGANQASLHDWLRSLPEDLHRLTLGLVRQILQTLKHTGLSPDGSYFSVAWPRDGIVNRCFRIPLDDHTRWTPMLADSDDCATFAYVTASRCLEAGRFKCRGPDPIWLNKIYLLETAVLCPTPNSNHAGSWTLSNGQTYFFRKLDDNLFWVKAQRDAGNAAAPAMLVRLISIESLPRDVRYRLLFKEEKKQERRLREKDLSFVKAEVVSVSSLRI